MRLAPLRPGEMSYSEHGAQGLAHAGINRSEADTESEPSLAMTGEAPFGGDEPANKLCEALSSWSHGSSGFGTDLVRALVSRSPVRNMDSGPCRTCSDARARAR